MILSLLVHIGLAIMFLGAFLNFLASIAMFRFPNFYTRLHALTMVAIGGTFMPLIGASIAVIGYVPLGNERTFIALCTIITAILIVILAPTGSHALARATYKAKAAPIEPVIFDHLKEHHRKKVS